MAFVGKSTSFFLTTMHFILCDENLFDKEDLREKDEGKTK